jgi:hypothetical protein
MRERPSVLDGDATKLFHQPTRGFHTFPALGRVCLRLIVLRRFTMTTSTEKSYFDLHITGLGYLNRIREVKPKKGDAFLACDIAALNGPSDDVSYVRFDTRVSGSEAQHLVRRCIQAVDAEKKVMIGFRLGDLWTDTFTYSKGKRAGEQGEPQGPPAVRQLDQGRRQARLQGRAQADRDRRARPGSPCDVRRARRAASPAPEPSRPVAEAADDAADAPALAVAESF